MCLFIPDAVLSFLPIRQSTRQSSHCGHFSPGRGRSEVYSLPSSPSPRSEGKVKYSTAVSYNISSRL